MDDQKIKGILRLVAAPRQGYVPVNSCGLLGNFDKTFAETRQEMLATGNDGT